MYDKDEDEDEDDDENENDYHLNITVKKPFRRINESKETHIVS